MAFLKDSARIHLNARESAYARSSNPRILSSWADAAAMLAAVAVEIGVPTESALAIWMVEAGKLPFKRGKPILRFECHKLWEHWGYQNEEQFDEHFCFGGRGKTSGAAWSNHMLRTAPNAEWEHYHGQQDGEYEAFALATRLAGLEAACLSSSFGGPQILGSNHSIVGYSSAIELYHAFAESLDLQVLGFFDFCRSKEIITALRDRNWIDFARVYNGPGQANVYAEHINDAYLSARTLLYEEPPHPSIEDKERFDQNAFETFVKTLGLKHFKAQELLFRGKQHSDPRHPSWGLNRLPPHQLWTNISASAQVLDRFRAEAGVPITLTSVYRADHYNVAVSGSASSRHCSFHAIDFEVRGQASTSFWLEKLRSLRSAGVFSGTLGQHGNAIHLDCHGENMDF